MNRKKAIVGMSGGVDSSVAAALLIRQGYDIAGVFMEVYDGEARTDGEARHACYGPGEKEDLEDARRVAGTLGIALHVVDLKARYRSDIIGHFIEEYASGRTPNPCVKCNRELKFGAVRDELRKRGVAFDYYATGHYARISERIVCGERRLFLERAADRKKDQSYFLYHLKEKQLEGLLFPLGGRSKAAVRTLAAEFGLDVAGRPESQDFVDGGYRRLFGPSSEPGPILDSRGKKLGEHDGLVHYTVGQRRGLGIGGGPPLYVLAKDAARKAIIVGPEEELYSEGLIASHVSWINFDRLEKPVRLRARIRYRHEEAAAEVVPEEDGSVRVTFEEPQRAIAPGQAVVFYDGDTIVGGGVIEKEVKSGQ